ncbi:hypothetical protein CSKR_200350 [Clonorchis sinensis]|uniref:Uncharacterized protein n=1 Tax=Clonorchis sinensis TaxID=79923 RepID=A0A8T1MDA4_CLOSI|nr:hypothetical protein CSKR_200350 [Clonorchis sinensis]
MPPVLLSTSKLAYLTTSRMPFVCVSATGLSSRRQIDQYSTRESKITYLSYGRPVDLSIFSYVSSLSVRIDNFYVQIFSHIQSLTHLLSLMTFVLIFWTM